MKKVIISISIVIIVLISIFSIMGIRGYYIVRANQLKIDKIETQIEHNKIDLMFASISLRSAYIKGKDSYDIESTRLEKIAKETDSLVNVRDSIYLNTPGTKIKSHL